MTAEERVCVVVRGHRSEGSVAGLCGLSRPVGILLRIVSSEDTLCLFAMSVSRRFKRGFVFCVLCCCERCCQICLAPTSLDIFQPTNALTLV